MTLASQKCKPCEGGIPPLKGEELTPWLKQIHEDWELTENDSKIRREFSFKNFVQTMEFANKVAEIAEQEGHHPDLHISYSKLVIELWTHKINGLFDNDFILAAKIDQLTLPGASE